jgi:hypothetical protein
MGGGGYFARKKLYSLILGWVKYFLNIFYSVLPGKNTLWNSDYSLTFRSQELFSLKKKYLKLYEIKSLLVDHLQIRR